MKLSEMKQILASGEIRLTKSLGQNFLHDANQLRRIVAAADLNARDRVLEIGPGLGPLTELLVAQSAEVFAIEKDQRLAAALQQRLGGAANFRLLVADALDYLRSHSFDWSKWKVVSNLPYSIASPLLVDFALRERAPERIVATLQLEVAHRLVASPGADDYGLLSLLMQMRFLPLGSFRISKTCFFPEPDIDSATVILQRHPQPLLPTDEIVTFVALVKLAFSQRRKMMLKLLKTRWSAEKLMQCCEAAQLAPTVRAEEVSLAQFLQFTRHLHERAGRDPTSAPSPSGRDIHG